MCQNSGHNLGVFVAAGGVKSEPGLPRKKAKKPSPAEKVLCDWGGREVRKEKEKRRGYVKRRERERGTERKKGQGKRRQRRR